MQTRTKLWILTGVLLLSRVSFAQPEKESPGGFYHLDFVIREMDDNKLISTRTYSTTVAERSQSSIRTGSRVPTPTRAGDTQFTYVDLGVSIDCRDARETAGQFSLNVSTDISTAATDAGATVGGAPVIRQYKWSSTVVVPLRKATQIFSSDDLGSKRKLQVELTSTPIK